MNILFVIDNLEFKYFEFNKLVTSFWLIESFLKRGYKVDVTTKDQLYLNKNIPMGIVFKSFLKENNLLKEHNCARYNLNSYNAIFFRPDPPVDNDYINATYVLDYVSNQTFVVNNPQGLRNANEKLFINNFPKIIPENITTASPILIKEFLHEKKEIIIKPLNYCFSKGVFYLNNKDKNIHTIIDTATNSGTKMVMVQEFLPKISEGDKRLVYINGEIFDECVIKKHGQDDFKFNTHADKFFKKGIVSTEEKEIANYIKPKMEKEGLYIAGLDVIDNKVIEINVTSPCFFIKEVNHFFEINFEDKITTNIEKLIRQNLH